MKLIKHFVLIVLLANGCLAAEEQEAAASQEACKVLIDIVKPNISGTSELSSATIFAEYMEKCFNWLEKLVELRAEQMGNAKELMKLIPSREYYSRSFFITAIYNHDFSGGVNEPGAATSKHVLDYCPIMTHGILGEIAKLIENDEIKSIAKDFVSPAIYNGTDYFVNQTSYKMLNQLKANVRTCYEFAGTMNYKGELDVAALGGEPACNRVNVLRLNKLHLPSYRESLSHFSKWHLDWNVDSSQVGNYLLGSCLAILTDIHHNNRYKMGPPKKDLKLNKKQLAFAQELIDYLANTNSLNGGKSNSIIDRLNPRSFFNQTMKEQFFFDEAIRQNLMEKVNLDIRDVYKDGSGICEDIGKFSFYVSIFNIDEADLIPTVENLYLILAIDNLQVDLTQYRDHSELQSLLLWIMCQNFKLISRSMGVGDDARYLHYKLYEI